MDAVNNGGGTPAPADREYEAALRERYETVIKRIENSKRFADAPGVETSSKILNSLGHPDKLLEFIHVAGTNGKGSVCALTASALCEAGLKVGLFTSPHLIRFNERIRIFKPGNIINDMKNTCISDKDVVRLSEEIRGTADANGITLTMFDYCFAIAIKYFVENAVNIVVLECGLGGRLDSTNAISAPAVSVITSIGLDHMQYLGDTVAEIAYEKAGILKSGTDAVIGVCDDEARSVFDKRCSEKAVSVCFLSKNDTYNGMLGLMGEYQRRNAAVAECAVRRLYDKRRDLFPQGVSIDAAIEKGFIKAAWDGRFQKLRDDPLIIIDGAHNEHGVRALKESLSEAYPGKKFDLVMGVMKDKDFTGMLSDMLPLCDRFHASQIDYGRAMPAEELKETASQCGYSDTDVVDVKDISKLDRDTVIFGSLYFVGEVLAGYISG